MSWPLSPLALLLVNFQLSGGHEVASRAVRMVFILQASDGRHCDSWSRFFLAKNCFTSFFLLQGTVRIKTAQELKDFSSGEEEFVESVSNSMRLICIIAVKFWSV